MTENAKQGRPSSYSETTADRICEQLMDGVSLRLIREAGRLAAPASVGRRIWLGIAPRNASGTR